MKATIFQTIEKLINDGPKTKAEIADRLCFDRKTLSNRIKEQNWQLKEIIQLEEIFDTILLKEVGKYYQYERERLLEEESSTYAPRPAYKIKVELDPNFFDPLDFDRRNKELTDELIRRFQRKNIDDSEE